MYFEKPGKVNTEQTLKLAYARGKELGIDEVVLASTKGTRLTKRWRSLTTSPLRQ